VKSGKLRGIQSHDRGERGTGSCSSPSGGTGLREIIRRWPNQTEVTVKARKLLQADSPDEIGAAISCKPEKTLIFEVHVPATAAEVWRAFSSNEGLSTWLTPNATVDLRPGGKWTAHFPGGKAGGGTIISFVAEKEMVLAAMATEQYPTVRRERTTARFEFIAEGKSTLVRLKQTGWKSGEEWDKAYQYLAAGNAELLQTPWRRFTEGPIDWAREWGAAK
jgi:uncharacterized protein YndB with AHSA1/START domain